MQIIPRMAAALQDLLTVRATEIGTECPLIKRRREFTASSLLATFVLGFFQWPKPTWDQLALVARQLGANVAPQAVLQRITPALADALAQLWQAAVGCAVAAAPRATPLLAKFTQVLIGDSTTIRLADEMASQFPGCGGAHGSGRVALKLQVIWDYLSGQLCRMRCEAGKQNDSTSPVMFARRRKSPRDGVKRRATRPPRKVVNRPPDIWPPATGPCFSPRVPTTR